MAIGLHVLRVIKLNYAPSKVACFQTQENISYWIIKNIRAVLSVINSCALLYGTIINYYGLQCVINQEFGTTVCNKLLHTVYRVFEHTAKTGVGGV